MRGVHGLRDFHTGSSPLKILVGPKNEGKSTILAAFRIPAAGMRTANRRTPEMVHRPEGQTLPYVVDLSAVSIAEEMTNRIATRTLFWFRFNCPISFVPILGPVEHNERLYGEEADRLAQFNYRAARNFRNIWYHYPEQFDSFRAISRQTWPGIDIEPPKVEMSHEKPVLHMFCPEERIPREIFWAGFGFQV